MQFHPEEQKLKPLKHPLDPEVCQKAARYALRVCEEMSKRSQLLREEDADEINVALFERDEILPYLGELLGKGGFNNVYELERIQLLSSSANTTNGNGANGGGGGTGNGNNTSASSKPGQAMQRNRVVNGSHEKKLAVKFLSDDSMYSPEEFCNGAADLLMEAKYLTALAAHPHPALIQLHGVCSTGPIGFSRPERAGFFLVIDRLYDTLDRRIDVWRELQRRKVAARVPAKVIKALYLQRLMVAQDIASALRHLHKLEIVFRDLKPDNVGFDFQGRVKLFDFGLAKELDPKQKCKQQECNGNTSTTTTTTNNTSSSNGMGSPEKNATSSSNTDNINNNNNNSNTDLYNMSGGTGSRRFMAPEVALSEPYNLSADIYSYSILLWELLTLDKAFGNLSPEDHRDMCVKMNQRLELRKSWSITIQNLLQGCWARNPQDRPSAREVHKVLKQEIDRIYEEDFLSVAQMDNNNNKKHNNNNNNIDEDDRRKSM